MKIWFTKKNGIILFISLLILIFICIKCIGIKQKRIVQDILAAHGNVLYDFEYAFTKDNNRIPNYVKPKKPSTLLSFLFGKDSFGAIVYVQLKFDKSDPALFESLGLDALGKLQHLHLSGKGIDPQIFPALFKLQYLSALDLVDTQLDDSDVEKIYVALPSCTVVTKVNNSPISVLLPENAKSNDQTD